MKLIKKLYFIIISFLFKEQIKFIDDNIIKTNFNTYSWVNFTPFDWDYYKRNKIKVLDKIEIINCQYPNDNFKTILKTK